MPAFASPRTLRITEPDPFGDVTLAPASMTGRSEVQLARALAQALVERQPAAAARGLQQLQALFPQAPLTLRMAALHALMRR